MTFDFYERCCPIAVVRDGFSAHRSQLFQRFPPRCPLLIFQRFANASIDCLNLRLSFARGAAQLGQVLSGLFSQPLDGSTAGFRGIAEGIKRRFQKGAADAAASSRRV